MKKHPAGWTPRVGDVVQIEFKDHTEHDGEQSGLLDFVVYGRLSHTTRLSYTVHSWAYIDESIDTNIDGENVKAFSIARSAIVDIYKLTKQQSRSST